MLTLGVVALGVTDVSRADPGFVVLADPDGNRFCVVDLTHEPGPAS